MKTTELKNEIKSVTTLTLEGGEAELVISTYKNQSRQLVTTAMVSKVFDGYIETRVFHDYYATLKRTPCPRVSMKLVREQHAIIEAEDTLSRLRAVVIDHYAEKGEIAEFNA